LFRIENSKKKDLSVISTSKDAQPAGSTIDDDEQSSVIDAESRLG